MMRTTRFGIGSAAALALFAGTAMAQQSQQNQGDKEQKHHQMGQSTQYRQSDDWRSVDFVQELSDSVVILKSEDPSAQVNIIHGQIEAKLDGEKISSDQVEKKGDKLRVLGDDGNTVAEFTLPDLQMIQQARLGQGGMQRQLGIQEDRGMQFDRSSQLRDRQFGTQEQWRDDTWRQQDFPRQQESWRQQETWRSQQDWRDQNRRFDDRQPQSRQFQEDDWRFRNLDRQDTTWRSQRYQDDRFGTQQRFRDQRFQDDRFQDREPQMNDQYRPEPPYERPHRSGQYRSSETFGQSGMYTSGGRAEQHLGISVSPAPSRELRQTRHQQGMVIEHMERNSPLAMHGLRPGDIIVEVDGRPATHNNLERTITQLSDRDTLELTAVRNGQARTFHLRGSELAMGGMDTWQRQEFRDQPYTEYRQDRFQSDRRVYGSFESDMQTPQMLGLHVEEARTSDLRSSNVGSRYHTGTEVIRVMNNSPADRAGLRSGDIIVEIDGRSNITPDLLHRRLSQRSGQPVELTVIRNDRERNITLRGDSFDNRRFGTDQRFDDSWGTPRDQFRRPSDQEDLFRLPGQVPPGPDRGVYQPRYDERQNEWGEFSGDRREFNTRGNINDRRWDSWDRRNDFDRRNNEDRWDW